MATLIKIRRSSVGGKQPTTVQLEVGELAINTYDGKLFSKKSVGGTESIFEIGATGYTGSIGYTGSKGDIGYAGSRGDIGYVGSVGYTGSRGVLTTTTSSSPPGSPNLGDIWIDSNTGTQYFYIYDGDSNQWVELANAGTIGVTGYTGSQGSIGYTGSQGAGYTGSRGDTGYNGSFGATGYTGSKGDTGYTGSAGFANGQSLEVVNLIVSGNVSGSAANVTIVAGAFTTTFANNGTVTFPANISVTGNVTSNNLTSRTTGSWTVATGSNTYSITVPVNGNYQMWVRANIPNGIFAYQATVSVTNTNVPVLGTQRGYNYTGGGSPILLTTMPTQIVGAEGTISNATVSTTTANQFDFVINNSSGSSQTVYWGYVTL
jgi:hypothetical protein